MSGRANPAVSLTRGNTGSPVCPVQTRVWNFSVFRRGPLELFAAGFPNVEVFFVRERLDCRPSCSRGAMNGRPQVGQRRSIDLV